MKAKTAFESGNSPPKVSENGAPIQTGRGLEQVKQRILRAFEQVHGGHPAPKKQPQIEVAYTENHRTRFHERAKWLSMAALETSDITTKPRRTDVACWEISVPSKTAEELIAEALRRDE